MVAQDCDSNNLGSWDKENHKLKEAYLGSVGRLCLKIFKEKLFQKAQDIVRWGSSYLTRTRPHTQSPAAPDKQTKTKREIQPLHTDLMALMAIKPLPSVCGPH